MTSDQHFIIFPNPLGIVWNMWCKSISRDVFSNGDICILTSMRQWKLVIRKTPHPAVAYVTTSRSTLTEILLHTCQRSQLLTLSLNSLPFHSDKNRMGVSHSLCGMCAVNGGRGEQSLEGEVLSCPCPRSSLPLGSVCRWKMSKTGSKKWKYTQVSLHLVRDLPVYWH